MYLPEEENDAKDTKRCVEKEGKECLLIPGNLMDNKTCREAVEKFVEKCVVSHPLFDRKHTVVNLTSCRFRQINVLVNNASKQLLCQSFDEINLDDVESTFRSNILQMFAITKYALPHMKKGSSYVPTLEDVDAHR